MGEEGLRGRCALVLQTEWQKLQERVTQRVLCRVCVCVCLLLRACSCRLYVPVFLPDVDLSPYPNVVKYMDRCAS